MDHATLMALLRLQAERYEALAATAPPGSGCRAAAAEVVRVTREAIAWYSSLSNIQ